MTAETKNQPPVLPREPIIVGIFQVLGVFILIGAAVVAFWNFAIGLGCAVTALFYFGFAKVIALLAQISADLKRVQETRGETVKALQWMVDNWQRKPD